jgi:hypothetical protein
MTEENLDKQKKRGRPPKMSQDEDLESKIDSAIEKQKIQMEEEIRTQVEAELREKITLELKKEMSNKNRQPTSGMIDEYLQNSSLASRSFAVKLMAIGFPAKLAFDSHMRDEMEKWLDNDDPNFPRTEENPTAKLKPRVEGRKRIWEYARKQSISNKKRR